jgi:hypothetical protein
LILHPGVVHICYITKTKTRGRKPPPDSFIKLKSGTTILKKLLPRQIPLYFTGADAWYPGRGKKISLAKEGLLY